MKTMRTAIILACLAAFPVWSYGTEPPKPVAGPAQEQQTPPVAQSPKAIPNPPPDAAKTDSEKGETAKPDAAKADPAKMAAPSAVPGAQPTIGLNEHTYLIGPEDVLGVLVWGNAALSAPAMVRPDGKITVGLIGEVMAAGQTPEKLGQEITDRLKNGGYILNPKVTVSVTQINSKTFFIQGEVNKPGRYSLVVPTTVLEALVNAGGFRDFANKKDIRIIRGDKQHRFNYNQVIKGKNRDQNIQLMPGDLIVVR